MSCLPTISCNREGKCLMCITPKKTGWVSAQVHVGSPPRDPSPLRQAVDGPSLEEMLAPEIPTRRRANAFVPPAPKSGDFVVPNPQLYHVDRVFMDFLNPGNQQGWKIHVSAPSDYELSPAYRGLLEGLQAKKVPHKYIKSRDFMRKAMNTHETQTGKFLTIYPDNEKQLREIVALTDGTLDPMNFLTSPRVPGDKPMSERNKISIRYGGLTSPVIVKPEKLGEEGANRKVENYMIDPRNVYKPEGIRDPFDPTSRGEDGWVGRDVGVLFKASGGGYDVTINDKAEVIDRGTVQ